MPDPTFDAFRRKLADAVTIAINNGVSVSASDKSCCCPLGCLLKARGHRPNSYSVWEAEGVPFAASAALGRAFDSGTAGVLALGYPEYAALGLAYRSRFP